MSFRAALLYLFDPSRSKLKELKAFVLKFEEFFLFHKSSAVLKSSVEDFFVLYWRLYSRNLDILLLSKKVEFTAVEAAAEVSVLALFRANDAEFRRLVSFTKRELSFKYFTETGEKLCVRLVVYVRLWALICLKALEACKLSTPIVLKFIRFKIFALSAGITKIWAGETLASSTFDW
jgi:hypothetical protein